MLLGSARGATVDACVGDGPVTAPDVLIAEVLQAIKGLERGRHLSGPDATLAVASLLTGPVQLESSRALAPAAWALRHNSSIYDALYITLALRERAPLLTADRGMADAALQAGVTVTLA